MAEHKLDKVRNRIWETLAFLFTLIPIVCSAYDVNGDGQEGLAESIHALQIVAGMSPSSSNIIYVGQVGTTAENGQALLAVLTSISDATSTNPYMIKIEPGIYDLGANGLHMLEYVDIEGSGENTTTITSTHSGATADLSATIYGADNAELRFITIENKGGGTISVGMYNDNSSPDITKTAVRASGGTTTYGLYNSQSFTKMTHLSIQVSGGSNNYGIYNVQSPTTISDVQITASGGFNSHGMYEGNNSGSVLTNVTMKIFGAYGAYGFKTYSNYSPDHWLTINNLTINSSASAIVYGMRNEGCTLIEMNNSSVRAFGGSNKNAGIYVDMSCNFNITGTRILIGGTNADGEQPNGIGLDNGVSTVTLKNSDIAAISGFPRIQAIWSGSGEVNIVSSMIGGWHQGDLTCVGAYDQTFAALNSGCSN